MSTVGSADGAVWADAEADTEAAGGERGGGGRRSGLDAAGGDGVAATGVGPLLTAASGGGGGGTSVELSADAVVEVDAVADAATDRMAARGGRFAVSQTVTDSTIIPASSHAPRRLAGSASGRDASAALGDPWVEASPSCVVVVGPCSG